MVMGFFMGNKEKKYDYCFGKVESVDYLFSHISDSTNTIGTL